MTTDIILALITATMSVVTLLSVRMRFKPCRRREPTRYYGFTITGGDPAPSVDQRANWENLSAALKTRLYE